LDLAKRRKREGDLMAALRFVAEKGKEKRPDRVPGE